MKIEFAKTEIIHFIGIGGIGMSGLALIMKGMGFKVQGSDILSNKNIERLKKNKIKVIVGSNLVLEKIPEISDVVVVFPCEPTTVIFFVKDVMWPSMSPLL